MAGQYHLPVPSNHKDFVNQQRAEYQSLLARGEIYPLVYPFALLPVLLPGIYQLIPWYKFPRLRLLRFPIFGLISYISIWIAQNCRSPSKGVDYGIGFVACFSVYFSIIWILLNNPQEEVFRIWRRYPVSSKSTPKNRNSEQTDSLSENGATTQSARTSQNDSNLSKRKKSRLIENSDNALESKAYRREPGNENQRLFWQGYPRESFRERLKWTLHLFSDLRGVGWNWCIDGLPPPPKAVQQELPESRGLSYTGDPSISPSGHRGYINRAELIRQRLVSFTLCYAMLDFLKVWMMKDQYFWGLVDAPAPSCLPLIFQRSSVLLQTYRMLVSAAGIYSALSMLFSGGDILFVGLLGPDFINVAGEAWIYPDKYGSIISVFDKGLAGFWGGWWHQLFRFAFSSPSKWILKKWKVDRKSTTGKLIQLFVAFSMSGGLHASASYGQLPVTNPLTGPFLFFFLQSFGMIGEVLVVGQLKRRGYWTRIPLFVKRAGNVTWVLVWFYFTSPLLTEDFARGGIWLFEPVPISPLRGLGFGLKGEGWLTYDLPLGTWHRGSRWWLSGIAL